MPFIDISVAAVANDKKAAYLDHCRAADVLFKEAGALSVIENWGADVPDGKVTDFKKAVQAGADETVAVGWIVWPDKATRDTAWEKLMQDDRMMKMDMPFDGKRMIFGGFETIYEL
ncbi:MAG: DUF1428 domain-containing protein [Brevundimonas sp.]|nr:MAG: DUF1428 domain-containing protein [Brevundimonas sp.]